MCLDISRTNTTTIRKLLAEKKRISVYKYLIKQNDKLLSYGCFQWQIGVNTSDRETVALTKDEKSSKTVHHGFHVYVDKERGGACLRFIAKAEDFVAGGTCGEAVFRKLTLPKDQYNKALGIVVKKVEKVKQKVAKKAVKKVVKKAVKKVAKKK